MPASLLRRGTPEEATALAGRRVLSWTTTPPAGAASRRCSAGWECGPAVSPTPPRPCGGRARGRAGERALPARGHRRRHLAGQDGFALVERLDEGVLPAPRRLLLLSAADRTQLRAVPALGVAGHLTKPSRSRRSGKRCSPSCFPAGGPRLSRPSDAEPTRPTGSPAPLARLRILLVDDHEFNRRVGVRKLEAWGHKVVTASCGGEALALLQHENFDLASSTSRWPTWTASK